MRHPPRARPWARPGPSPAASAAAATRKAPSPPCWPKRGASDRGGRSVGLAARSTASNACSQSSSAGSPLPAPQHRAERGRRDSAGLERAAQGERGSGRRQGAVCGATGILPHSADTSSARIDAPRRARARTLRARGRWRPPQHRPVVVRSERAAALHLGTARASPHRREHAHLREPTVDGAAELIDAARQYRAPPARPRPAPLRAPPRDRRPPWSGSRSPWVPSRRWRWRRPRPSRSSPCPGTAWATAQLGPRLRYPVANSPLDRKSPNSVPTTSPSCGPASARASSMASRHAATENRQMRESRRAASRSISVSRRTSSTSAPRTDGSPAVSKPRMGAMPAMGRASASATAAAPPAPAALTMPIPVTTTRRAGLIGRTRGSRSARRSRRSCSSRPPAGRGRAAFGTQSKGTSGSTLERFAVGGMSPFWSASTVATASRLPAAAMVWPTSDLVELTGTPPRPEHAHQSERLGAVVLQCPRPVGVDVVDGSRRKRRVRQRQLHGPRHPLPLGLRRGHVIGIGGHARAEELGVHVPPRARQASASSRTRKRRLRRWTCRSARGRRAGTARGPGA